MSALPVLFVDRDGTLVEEPDDEQVDRLDKIRLVSGVIPALLRLRRHGYRLVIVSNQDGLGTDAFPQADFDLVQNHIRALFGSQGIEFDHEFYCPHVADDRCACRKPATGLLTRYLTQTTIDVARSAVVGDRETDVALAGNLGLRSFRLGDWDWPGIAEELCLQPRRATVERRTRETDIVVEVSLDTVAPVSIRTGIGFFDHMLEQIARHSETAISIRCSGDTHVDEHHTVEDVALALGQALRQALGDKRGIARYGFVVPMDEAQARAALDLSGRPAFRFDGQFARERVGELSTEMVRHFFQSLSDALGAALHLEVSGENTHHMVEACFKATGRVLGQAMRRSGDELPSTKGVL